MPLVQRRKSNTHTHTLLQVLKALGKIRYIIKQTICGEQNCVPFLFPSQVANKKNTLKKAGEERRAERDWDAWLNNHQRVSYLNSSTQPALVSKIMGKSFNLTFFFLLRTKGHDMYKMVMKYIKICSLK